MKEVTTVLLTGDARPISLSLKRHDTDTLILNGTFIKSETKLCYYAQ